MVRQVNRYFVCDTVAELDNIRFDNLEGIKAFIRSTPSEEYIYSGGGWQLIAGSTVITQIESTILDLNDKLDIPTGTPDGTKYLRDDNTWQPVAGGSGLSQQQSMTLVSFKI